MKKIFLVILAILVLLGILFLVIYFLNIKGTASVPVQNNTPSGNSFPIASSTTSTTQSNGVITIPTENGGSIDTNDFLHNGTTIEDPANTGTYYLAGSSGACKADGSCPKAGNVTDFTILYYPSTGSFNIGLATEPLGQVRKEAEQYLMNELGLTQTQMCDLKYNIGTTSYVNPQYGGENLGFSFCPGSVTLPQ